MRRSKRQANADFSSGARHAGLWQFADVDLWRRTCGAVLNEVRRVLIVFSKLAVNGAFPPMPDYSRSYEKQYKGRGPQGDVRTAMIFISRSGALFRTSALAFPSVLVKGNPDAVGLSLCAARGNVRDRRKPAPCSSITRVQ
jgi:hypothetical protein